MSFNKALIIDDSEIDRFISSKIMEQCRFADQVVCAASGEEGFTILLESFLDRAEPPAFIFLDINMPGMDGFEFLEIYQSLPEEFLASVRLVVLTSSTDPKDIERVFDYKVVARYLNKPLQQEDLIALSQPWARRA
jgi:CheY-like chemotaxis protein